MAKSRLRILVLGYIVRGPLGGLTWHHLQYVIGLRQLGHDVYFLEDSDDYPSCYDPVRDVTDANPGYGLRYATGVFGKAGLEDRWAYYDAHARRWLGPCARRAEELCSTAELLLNLSGVNPLRPWHEHVPWRALVDTDPVFTQISHVTDPDARKRARRHGAFFSFAHNVGGEACSVPNDGLRWQPTRQPVVLDAWPVTPGPRNGSFTSVLQWDSYEPREHDGTRYGMKSESFRPYADLPRRTAATFELAVGSPGAPRTALRERGWTVRDPRPLTRDPWTYQRYIRGSKAEFGVAKHGYVVSRSGWFSERSTAYLASGRPVVAQNTGYSDWLPTGSGLIPFESPDGALAAVEEVSSRYESHSRAARALVEEHFDSRKVLPPLIEAATSAGSAPGSPR